MKSRASTLTTMVFLAAGGIGQATVWAAGPGRWARETRMENSVLVVRHRVARDRRVDRPAPAQPDEIIEPAPAGIKQIHSEREPSILLVHHQGGRTLDEPDTGGADATDDEVAESARSRPMRAARGRTTRSWRYERRPARKYQRTAKNTYRATGHRQYQSTQRRAYRPKRSWTYHPR